MFSLRNEEFGEIYLSVGIAVLTVNLWIAESIPIYLASLIPLLLIPLHGILSFEKSISNYYNNTIRFFLGGFLLAYSIEKWHLHKRIAYKILSYTGENPRGILAGMMLSTCLISMWISNTATAIMMLPVAISVSSILNNSGSIHRNFFICMMLGIAYSANIGGIATITGTPPNIVYKGYLETLHKLDISFFQWMIFGIPLSLIMLWITYHLLSGFLFKISKRPSQSVANLLDEQYEELGKISTPEKRTLIIFTLTALLWILNEPIQHLIQLINPSWTLKEHQIALGAGIILLISPSGNRKGNRFSPLLVPKDLKSINWNILILFGGGMCMAKGLAVSGALEQLGILIKENSHFSIGLLLLILIALALYSTEIMSNVALSQIFIPVVFGISEAFGMSNVHQFGLPVVFACSFAFMFPISTPPNAVVFSSGKVSMKDMAFAGFFINIVGILLLWAFGLYIVPHLF